MGSAAPADLCSRPARVSDVPQRDAPRRLHHATVGDRPDPYAPPHPGDHRRPRRRTESPVDARTVWTGRHATTRRGPPGPLSLPPTPRPRAVTFGVRVRSTGLRPVPAATGRPRRTPSGRPPRRGGGRRSGRRPSRGQRARRAEVGRRPSRGQRARRTFTDTRPTSIEFAIPHAGALPRGNSTLRISKSRHVRGSHTPLSKRG